jgi:small subunit ribosomal protein S17
MMATAPEMSGNSAPTDALAGASKRTLVGRVISNKMDKTVTVLIERRVRHPMYGKYLVRSTKLHAHDATDAVGEGDLVEIVECRPHSRTKNWMVTRVLEAARSI